MLKAQASGTLQPVPLDVCRICQFVWFDPREFAEVGSFKVHQPRRRTEPVDRPLNQEAKEKLALWQVKQMAERQREEASPDTWQYLPGMLGLPVEVESDGSSWVFISRLKVSPMYLL
jgi:hypothetical protein